jgi:sortase (surface protein transpeptidase)
MPNIEKNPLRFMWTLRYRLYSILVIVLVSSFIFYSSSTDVKPNISATGYEVIEQNLVAQKLKLKNQNLNNPFKSETNNSSSVNLSLATSLNSSASSQNIAYDYTSQDLETTLANINPVFKMGVLNVETMQKAGLPIPINSRIEQVSINKFLEEVSNRPKSLDSIYSKQQTEDKVSFLQIPKYKITAPIVYPGFDTMFNKNSSGLIDFYSPLEGEKLNGKFSEFQKVLTGGVAMLPFSPFPGEIGNSYIVGHSNNYPDVKSDYNSIFAPIKERGEIGDEANIWDPWGRKLTFRLFQTEKIEESDVEKAYHDFPGKRVLTLQTSIVSTRIINGRPITEVYERWLWRMELICPDGNPCTV